MVKILNTVRKFLHVAIEMKATEQYFPVVLFIMLYKVVLTFESLKLKLSRWNSEVWPFKWKLLSSTFLYAAQGNF